MTLIPDDQTISSCDRTSPPDPNRAGQAGFSSSTKPCTSVLVETFPMVLSAVIAFIVLLAIDLRMTSSQENQPMSVPSRLYKVVIGSLLVLGTMGAHAAINLGFLSDTPISLMRQADIASIQSAVNQALDTKQDGESLDWTNDATRNRPRVHATITPSHTVKEEARTCRVAAIDLSARGQTMHLTPRFCRSGSDNWEFQRRH
ncbi:hypothetical protein QF001_002362 [Paraburkholderia youngii]